MKTWMALFLALTVLASAGAPAYALTSNDPLGEYLYREEDYGGLAPPLRGTAQDSRPAEDEDHGGIAPTTPYTSNGSARPAGEDDHGGIAPASPSPSDGSSRPAGDDDHGGIAPSSPSPSDGSSRPAGDDDHGGIAPTSPSPSDENARPAEDDDHGGIAPTNPYPSNGSARPAGEEDHGGVAPKDPSETYRDPTAEGIVLAGTRLYTAEHLAYAYGSNGSLPLFHPDRALTRAEAAQMLFRLLPPGTSLPPLETYEDVPADAWYAEAVRTLAALGVLEVREGRTDPEGIVTRGEFTRYIAAFFPLRTDAELFPDVAEEDPNAPYIRSARAYGWAKGGSDGRFQPEQSIHRAGAAALLNRALGRAGDPIYIGETRPAFYLDVSPDSWYYYDVLEATVSHSHTDQPSGEFWTSHTAPQTPVPSHGIHLADGWQYYYDSARGDVVRSGQVGSFSYDAAGHFTTGSAELDGKLRSIVLAQTNPGMSQEEMLRALFLYTRDSFTYLRRPAYAFGATDFMLEDALRILNTGYGNCYCYAALYWYLCRWIGYDAVIYSGTVGSNRAPHSWVEINLDGRNYIFDTELEMAYRRKNRFDINLYKYFDAADRWMYRRPAQ